MVEDKSPAVSKTKLNEQTNLDTLLIIGNGFDKCCGLASLYSEFFEYTSKKYSSATFSAIKNIFENKGSENDFSEAASHACFWELYFYCLYFERKKQQIGKWADVEKEIRDFIFGEKPFKIFKEIYNPDPKIGQTIRISSLHLCSLKSLYHELFSDTITENNHSALIAYYQEKLDIVVKWLMSDLIRFEKNFTDYLNDFIEHKNNKEIYYSNAKKLLEKIAPNNNSVSIISFNYPLPFEKDELLNTKNVHGTLKHDNVIFGIDEKSKSEKGETIHLDHNDPKYIFTKTFRALGIETSKKPSLPKSINHIKFFGHSLADADYSYFQSIFDYYDIYNSNCILHFCYTPFQHGEFESKKLDAYKLIKSYGNTLDNKDKGKNLLHKLMLEGRIEVESIKLEEDLMKKLSPLPCP